MVKDVTAVCADCPLSSIYPGMAGVTVRMEHGGRVYGVLSVSTPAEMAADAYEQLLFNEVAGDIASALHDMELDDARKRAEEALQRFSEELELKVEERTKELAKEHDYTRHLIESSPDFQMILDKNGRIMDVNKAFLCVVGKSREALIGSSIYNCLPKEETEKAIAEILEKGKVRNIELTVDIRGKGTLISNFSGTIFTTPEGRKEIYVTGRDITEQRRVEEVLLESEEKFRTFMETASDLMIFTDKDENITYANEAMVGTLGYSKEELIGMHVTQLLSEQALERDFKPENLKKLITEGKLSLETIYATKDGKEIYGELKVVAVYDNNGKYAGGRTVFYDLTERKRAEDQIKTSLKEKEILILEIHHRVKNNLQIILSLIDMQARATEDKDVKDALFEARDRIMAMSLIHSQLYESSDLTDINMNEFVDRLLGQLLRSYQAGDTRITRAIRVDDYPFPISAAVPVGLIINELLSNALKHAFNGRDEGKIEVRLAVSEDGRANLAVSDDGAGLPPGFNIDESKTLGLRLVKILTEDQLQGTLEITSDGGATFKMEFDIKDSGSDRLT
jgi:PAS domain S-box-containing protein